MVRPQLDETSGIPIYRQLFEQIRARIAGGQLSPGERLPPTRELAASLHLNRATVTAAYSLLEKEGLISGRVGRGSFVLKTDPDPGVRWENLLDGVPAGVGSASPGPISFATSRPPADLFPIEEFRTACEEVMNGPGFPDILQLGSPAGYEPLREHLLEDARRRGLARPADDLMITNGCQQALDLVCRAILKSGDRVAVEDPVYPGLKNLFARADVHLIGLPVDEEGVDPSHLEAGVKLAAVTPNFQNPTGATLPLDRRLELVKRARQHGTVLIENDIYGPLRYQGEAAPALKLLDERGDVVMLGSFSKIAFPGLRVGWVLGPKPLIAHLAHLKLLTDLHTNQFSQATLLRFAESGGLQRHLSAMLKAGVQRLSAVLAACASHLPAGSTFTRPLGGMNVWVTLPEALDTHELLGKAREGGVSYLPGRYFSLSGAASNALRLSFASLPPELIAEGLAVLGNVFRAALARDSGPVMAVV
jgi:DNA-binding transcriptional MocR family regulator